MTISKTTIKAFSLALIILFFVRDSFTQNRQLYNEGFASKSFAIGNANDISKSVSNTVLLTQDFSSTTFPPTGWTMSIPSGTLGWSRGVGPQTYITFNPNGTTAANGYAFVNSDGCGGLCGAEETILRTPAINCVGHSYVWLKFNSLFYQYSASTGIVEVSNNGTSWINVFSAHTGLGANEASPNPQFVDINVSAYAGNQATFYVRFRWTGNYDYYWFIDDVEVYSKDPYDVALESAMNLNEYSVVPESHFNGLPMPLTATAKNVGGAAVSGVKVNFNIYDATNNLLHTALSNVSGPLAAGSTVDLSASPYTIPLTAGYYKTEYIVSMTQQDANSSNDTLYRYFRVSDTIYARDEAFFTNTLDGSLGIAAGGTVVMGQNFRLKSPDKLSRVRFYVTGPAVGDTTTMFLYSTLTDGTPAALLAQSNPFIYTTAGAQWVTLQFNTGALSLDSGTYFIGIRDHHSTDNIGLAYNNVNYTPDRGWVKINDDPWQKSEALGFPCAYVIRPFFVCAGYKPIIQPSGNVGICQGIPATLTASAGSSYLWSPGGETTQAIQVTTPGAYSVSVTNSYGCSALSDNVNVSVVNNPVVNLGNDTTVCGMIVLDAGGPYANYSWAGGSSATQFLNVTGTGQYIVVVTDSLGCVGIDTINVTVTTGPSINLGNDMLLCDYETAVLDAGQGFTSYLWNNQATSQTITVEGSSYGVGTHQFSVVISDANNCIASDTINITFQTCVGIYENGDNSLKIYPNPANDYLNIMLDGINSENTIVEVYNMLGKLIISYNISENDNLSIAVKNMSSGIYYLKLTNNNKYYVAKFIVE